MKNFKQNLLLLFFSILCTGCATVFCGDRQQVTFKSDPPGANVYDSFGNYLGRTPLKTKVLRECRSITFKKAGYETLTVNSGRHFQFFPMIIDAIYWPTLIVDAYTGDCYGLTEEHFVKLDPK